MGNKKKKRYGIVAALLLLVLAAGVGTYAWADGYAGPGERVYGGQLWPYGQKT